MMSSTLAIFQEYLQRYKSIHLINNDVCHEKLKQKLLVDCMEQLSSMSPDKRFPVREIGELLKEAAQNPQFSLQSACGALSEIEHQILSVVNQPWREEYQLFKMYSGNFNVRVASLMPGALSLFFLLGFVRSHEGYLELRTDPDVELFYNVAFAVFLCVAECKLIYSLYTHSHLKHFSHSQVTLERLRTSGDISNVAVRLKDVCRDKISVKRRNIALPKQHVPHDPPMASLLSDKALNLVQKHSHHDSGYLSSQINSQMSSNTMRELMARDYEPQDCSSFMANDRLFNELTSVIDESPPSTESPSTTDGHINAVLRTLDIEDETAEAREIQHSSLHNGDARLDTASKGEQTTHTSMTSSKLKKPIADRIEESGAKPQHHYYNIPSPKFRSIAYPPLIDSLNSSTGLYSLQSDSGSQSHSKVQPMSSHDPQGSLRARDRLPHAATGGMRSLVTRQAWDCSHCTLHNDADAMLCKACHRFTTYQYRSSHP